jgi:hypothetical protein
VVPLEHENIMIAADDPSIAYAQGGMMLSDSDQTAIERQY